MTYVKVDVVASEPGATLKRKTKTKTKNVALVKGDVVFPTVDRRGMDKTQLTLIGIKTVAAYLGTPVVEGQEYDLKFGKVKVSVQTQSTNLNEITGPLNGWVKDPDVDLNQDCDVFVFTRVNPATLQLFIAGWITKAKFYDAAVHYNAGDKIGCTIAHDAGYSILYEALTPMANLTDSMNMSPRRVTAWSKAALEKSRRGQ